MDNILVLPDNKLSHLIPTLRIAENLQDNHFNVVYCGPQKIIGKLHGGGFNTFVPDQQMAGSPIVSVLNGALDPLVDRFKPSAILTSAHNALNALVFYLKYKIETILVWTHFPEQAETADPVNSPYAQVAKRYVLEKIKYMDPAQINDLIIHLEKTGFTISKMQDLVRICDRFNHFVTCPETFLTKRVPDRENVLYLGPCMSRFDMFGSDTQFSACMESLRVIARHRKLIFCSFGSMAEKINRTKAIRTYRLLIDSMRSEELSSCHLVLGLGNLLEEISQVDLPDNVSLYKWLPQKELLKMVSLAIIHGGLGSVKECIMEEVPMVICPLGYDQFENAERIDFHQLGGKLGDEQTSDNQIAALLSGILDSADIKQGLAKMKKAFAEREEEGLDVQFIRRIPAMA